MPHFWLGLLMIILFAVEPDWLPAWGYVSFGEDPIGNLRHMLMPAIVLGTGFSAVLMRQTRSAMLTSLGADYVRTARAKGLSRASVVGKHALRNSLITVDDDHRPAARRAHLRRRHHGADLRASPASAG